MKNKRDFEMKFYELMGVKIFQSLVFQLEKIIHFKDKGKNINYHFKSCNIDELNNFKKYLYYNGAIHVRNSIGLVGFFVLQQLFFTDWLLLYIIPSFVKNVYCVMLQRYNCLRIDKVIEMKEKIINNRIERKKDKFMEENSDNINKVKENEASLKQIESLKKFLQGEEDAFLDESSLDTLNLIKNFLVTNNSNTNNMQQTNVENITTNEDNNVIQNSEENITNNHVYCKKKGGK